MNNPTDSEHKRKFWGTTIWVSAIALAFSVCAGVAAPLIGMIKAFAKLRTAGAADPAALASDISAAMIGSLICVPFAFASLVVFIIAIVRHKKFSNPALAAQ